MRWVNRVGRPWLEDRRKPYAVYRLRHFHTRNVRFDPIPPARWRNKPRKWKFRPKYSGPRPRYYTGWRLWLFWYYAAIRMHGFGGTVELISARWFPDWLRDLVGR